MMVFAFFLLALLALMFVVAPALLRSFRGTGIRHSEQAQASSRAWYEERLQAVEQDVLDEEDKTQLAEELAAVLLAEYPQVNDNTADANEAASEISSGESTHHHLPSTLRKPANILLFSGALLVALALGVYTQLGSYGASKIQGAQVVLALSPENDSAELQSWQIVLNAWLADQPDDAPSWYLLGHAHLKLGEFSQAERAFGQAHVFAESDVLVKLYWLQSRYLSQQGALDALSKQLAEEILAVNPNNQQVLEMLAVAAIAEGDAAAAITMLNRTLNTVAQPDRVRATVDAIAALRTSNVLYTNAHALQVAVNVADGVKANPHDTVFVVARPVGGGMPYAVVRRPSWLLPFSVTLDDLVSMSPARPISQADTVEVLVRLSATGTAEANPNDWRWLSEPIALAKASDEASSSSLRNLNAVLSPPD
ncbi:MAG: c-type cytochrome biogenesis protein CcmI [OM182 bacterium]|nr:MAG: c-type cytochrome biogenesis protein CcmI [OM182 bacterium]